MSEKLNTVWKNKILYGAGILATLYFGASDLKNSPVVGEEHFELNNQSVEVPRPTHEAIVMNAEHGGYDIAVCVVDAREKSPDTGELIGKTIIWPMSYWARLNEFERQRLTVIAERLKARVIGVELPGVGISENAKSVPFIDLKDPLTSRFDRSASAMTGALSEVVKFKDGEEVEFVLFSQGVVLGSHMVEDIENGEFGLNLKIPKITIFEDVNDWPINLKLLKIGKEDKLKDAETKKYYNYVESYLRENSRLDWQPVLPAKRVESTKNQEAKLDKKQWINLKMGGAALVLTSFQAPLYRAIEADKKPEGRTGVSKSDIRIVKLKDSYVSSIEGNRETVKRLRAIMPMGRVGLTLVSAAEGQEQLRHVAVVTSIPDMAVLTDKFLK